MQPFASMPCDDFLDKSPGLAPRRRVAQNGHARIRLGSGTSHNPRQMTGVPPNVSDADVSATFLKFNQPKV
jgi:hypothetical protein